MRYTDAEICGHMSHFLDGTTFVQFEDSSDCPFLLVRLLNGSSCKIANIIGEIYEWVFFFEVLERPILVTGQ